MPQPIQLADPVASQDSVDDRFADAFGPVALTNFATNPGGAHLFRQQHELLGGLMNTILVATERDVAGQSPVVARTALTILNTRLPLHQSLEDALIHSALGNEPRASMLAEQFERDMVPLLSDLASLSRRYPTASSILQAPPGEFAQACAGLFSRLRERFRREERDLFPAFDRATRGTPTLAAVA